MTLKYVKNMLEEFKVVEKMKTLILMVLYLTTFHIFVDGADESVALLKTENIHVSQEEVEGAEARLNQERDPSILKDTILIFKYLRSNGWNYEEISEHFEVDVRSVEKFLTGYPLCGTLLRHVHRYYENGGESLVASIPPHARTSNWHKLFISCFWPQSNTQNHIKAR
ncbi:MAG: hypothetical protein Q8K36_06545 [Alphaproteobacteria bacterium]|nr:hypothetical protein [Alphaproteobacteria bacterium]